MGHGCGYPRGQRSRVSLVALGSEVGHWLGAAPGVCGLNMYSYAEETRYDNLSVGTWSEFSSARLLVNSATLPLRPSVRKGMRCWGHCHS